MVITMIKQEQHSPRAVVITYIAGLFVTLARLNWRHDGVWGVVPLMIAMVLMVWAIVKPSILSACVSLAASISVVLWAILT